MIASISSPSSSGGASDYYVKGSVKKPISGQYYLSQDGPSFWGGGAKDALGLPDGPVQAADFINMLEGRLPNGQVLGRMVKGELRRDLGRDLTFSVSKTASLLATSEHGQPIIDAFLRANKMAFNFLEKNIAKTRIYDRDTKTQVVTGNQKIVYATFLEKFSRANEPQIHAHNVWPNIALGQDGKFRSAMMGQIFTHKMLLGSVARGYFGAELKKMGFTLEPAGRHGLFEIKGISREVIDAFSTRRADILKAAGSGPKDAISLSKLVLSTRPPKTKVSAADLIERQIQTLSTLGETIKSLWTSAQNSKSENRVSPADALDNAIANLSENQRDYSHFDLLKEGLMSVYGNVTVNQVQSEIEKRVKVGELLQSKDGEYFTTPKTLQLEKLLIAEANIGRLNGRLMNQTKFSQYESDLGHLTQGQFDAVKMILTDHEDRNGVQGFAGTGKTTLLKAALPLAKDLGLNIIGIAPSQTAVNGLKSSGVFDQVMTSQKFVLSPTGNSSTLLVVDEASMLGTKDMLAILRFANSKNMPKVVLMEDIAQLAAIRAGEPSKDLQAAGLRTAYVNEIVRQQDPRHREGVKALAEGNIPLAFETLKKEIHEVTRQDMISYAVNTWEKLNDGRAPIAVQNHKQKKLINVAIKTRILDRQTTPPAHLDQKVWKSVNLKPSERTQFRAYEDVTHILFNRQQKKLGVRGGEVYKVINRDKDCSSLKLSNGKSHITFVPSKHAAGESMIETYRTEDITLHTGDRIRFTRGQRGHIANNDLATIKDISDKDVIFELDKGKTVTLTKAGNSIRHLDHGWASTAHALQGLTVPNAMAIMPSHESPLTTLNNLYVGASRHAGQLAIITDNTERLVSTLEAAQNAKLTRASYTTDQVAPELEPSSLPRDKPSEQEKSEQTRKSPSRGMYLIDPRFLVQSEQEPSVPAKHQDTSKESRREASPDNRINEDHQRERQVSTQRERSRGNRGR